MVSMAAQLCRAYQIAILATVLVGTALVGAVYLLARESRAAAEAVTTAQGNMALGLEREILRNVDIYDLALRTAASGLQLLTNSIGEAAQRAILFDGSVAAQYFRPILIADGSGAVLHDAGATTPRLRSVADRPFFKAHRDHRDLGLLVLLNTRGNISGKPYWSLTRRVSGIDGGFEGTVSGGLGLEYFEEILSNFTVPSGGVIALIGYDGRLVAGFPNRENMAGRDVSSGGLLARARLKDFDSFESKSAVDGVTRLVTIRKLGKLPFFLVVGTPNETVYAQWRELAWTTGGALVAFVVIVTLFVAALSRELAKRRMADNAVNASERRLGTYVDHLADGILAIRKSADGRFVYERVNAAAARMLRIRPEDIIGCQPREVWPEPLAVSVEEKLRDCLTINAPLNYERICEGPDGTRVLRFILVPVQGYQSDDAGVATLLLASLRDVTDMVAMEAQLRQAQRMEAVGQLTAGVAHDFNNMFQAQLGALELLLKDVQDRPRAKKCAERALAAGQRGSSLTHSLLSFSGQQHLAPRAVPIDVLLDQLTEMLSRTVGPRVELRLQVDESTAAPFADLAQLESALLNLALNARDAMPEGGRIFIEARNGTATDNPPGDLSGSRSVLLAVSDTGVGMTQATAAKACEPFFTTKGVGKGSGLGLSMVQGFVQQSGGAMQIVSAPGRGTRVELWLPREAEAASVPLRLESPSLAYSGSGRRILLVDDEPDVLAVTAELLQEQGFVVVQASHGEEALTLLRTAQAFDVLVTDYMMPGIDGGELIRRAARMFPDLPTLVISGYAESDVLRGLPAKVDVMRKPVRGDALGRRVAALLDKVGTDRPQMVDVHEF